MTNYKLICLISIVYITIITVFLAWHQKFFSPDMFFAAALILTLILGRFKQFVKDWSFPTIWFLSYEYLRGIVPHLEQRAHIYPMIHFDEKIFGFLPPIKLQNLFFTTHSTHWYDYLAFVFYLSHFVVPFLLGFILWLKNKTYFKEYFLALIILSYAAFITFVLFPAVPPWLASQYGVIPPIYDIFAQVAQSFGGNVSVPTIYQFIGVNLVAAVPSLHAAYPLLTFLFVSKLSKRWGLLLIPYVLGVWLSVIYLGQHYVFDILIGAIYAFAVFSLVVHKKLVWRKVRSVFNLFERRVNLVPKPEEEKVYQS